MKKLFLGLFFLLSTTSHTFEGYTEDESNAYFSAVHKGNEKLFRTLDQDFGDTILRAMALDEAAEYKKDSILVYLLQRHDFSEFTLGKALHSAVKSGSEKAIKKLLEKGAPVDFKMEDKTPLMFASKDQRTNIIKVLLAAGANQTLLRNEGLLASDKPSSVYDYVPRWEVVALGVASIAAVCAVTLASVTVERHLHAWRYGNCAFCQESICDDLYTSRCGRHYFHRDCAEKFSENIQQSVLQYNNWRLTVVQLIADLPLILANFAIMTSLKNVDEDLQETYIKTLVTGAWQGIKFNCPHCREPL